MTDADLIEAFLARTGQMTQDDAAEAAGVSQKSMSRWRRGDRSKLHSTTRSRLVKFLRQTEEESAEDAVYDPGEVPDERPGIGEEEIVQLPQVTRHLKTFDGQPDAQVLKRAAVNAWGEILALNGPRPAWWYIVKEKVERGEL